MEIESMEERLEKLERTTRRYRLVLAGLGITVLACIVMWVVTGTASRAQAQKPGEAGKVVRANSFILEDANGKTRASLTVTWAGLGLDLFDERGKTRASLCVTEGGPMLGLSDEKGKTRVLLSVTGLSLSDERGKTRALLSVTETEPGLSLWDEKGKHRADLSVGEAGSGLSLWDESGKLRALLTVAEAGPALAALRDEKGKTIWTAP